MLAWILFILLNATLFLRPAELVPELEGLPLYELLIICCLLVSLPDVLRQLSVRELASRPISACVVGLLTAVVLSHLCHLNLFGTRVEGFAFAKVLIYFLLLTATVNTSKRLEHFIVWLIAFTTVLTILALLQYHQVINIASLAAYQQADTDPETGEKYVFARLCGPGIFNDPNDLCLILNLGIICCLYQTGHLRDKARCFLWLAPAGLFGYALALTYSRGGFLAFLTSVTVFLGTRFGLKRMVPLVVVMLPLVFFAFAGRQTDLSTSQGTGQDRIHLWAEGLSLFKGSPIFGIGKGQYAEEVGLVAHNSFIHCYVELGFFGGTLFFGAFFCAFWALWRLRPGSDLREGADATLLRFRPYLVAIVAAYAASFMSLSRPYVVPTYLVLGLVAAYLRVIQGRSRQPVLTLNGRVFPRMVGASVAMFCGLYVFVRVFGRFG